MTSDDTGGGRRSTGYQVLLTGMLSLNFGFVLFDRNAVSFLMPFIQPELSLNNTQVGLLSSGLALTWALSALGTGGTGGLCSCVWLARSTPCA